MPDHLPSLDILYTEARERLLRQLDDVDGLNTKASIVIGFDGVIITAAMAMLADLETLDRLVSSVWLPWVLPGVIGIGLLLVLASLGFSMAAYWCATYKEVIDPRGAYNELIALPANHSKLQLYHTIIVSYEENQKAIRRKSKLLTVSFLTLSAAVVAFLAEAAVVLSSVATV